MAQHQEWMSIEEVAAELKVSPDAARKLVEDGQLAAVAVGEELRVRASALEGFARRAERGAAARRLRRSGLALAGVAAAALATAVAIAASPPGEGEVVPRQIPYRGYLELNGAPVTNTAMSMRFDLFTQESAGVEAWSETQSVSVIDGNFTVALGDTAAIPAWLFAQPSLYLQIEVDGQQLAGRQRILTVPYAHAADSSDLVRGRDITTWLVPTGTISAFAGPTPPAGWALCDGAVLNREDYPELFATIGTAWGAPDSTTFNLPDLRGQFLRGVDAGAGVDLDAGTRTGASGGATGDAVGTNQANATAVNGLAVEEAGLHNHGDGVHRYYALWVTGGSTVEYIDSDPTEPDLVRPHELLDAGAHVHGLRGDAETRPVNASVNWIIKL